MSTDRPLTPTEDARPPLRVEIVSGAPSPVLGYLGSGMRVVYNAEHAIVATGALIVREDGSVHFERTDR